MLTCRPRETSNPATIATASSAAMTPDAHSSLGRCLDGLERSSAAIDPSGRRPGGGGMASSASCILLRINSSIR